jgi:hypothetical protein
VLKMTTGRLRLSLTDTAILVMHDCDVGTLNPTCLTCYWKTYNFSYSKRWALRDTLRIETAGQILRILRSNAVSVRGSAIGNAGDGDVVRIVISGTGRTLRFPVKNGILPRQITVHDLQGRLLAALPVNKTQYVFSLPPDCRAGVVIISCIMDDRSVLRQKVPLLK